MSVAFDLPTQIGYDSDHPLAAGEVGRVGVAIDSIEDMQALFDGIPLGTVSTSMTINSTAIILLALYVAVAKRQGVEPRVLTGTVQNDILKEYAARGTYIFPPGPSLRIVTDIIAFCEREVPQWNSISISGYHIREAGSTAVEEVAFTLANACAYVEACQAAGLDVNAFGQRLSFFFNAHSNFLEEIAKFRAARRLWARLMRDRYGATNPRAQQLRFHTQTAGSTLTAQQPANNIVRVALQALSAVLGGTQSLHCNGSDEALGLPTEQSADAGAAHPADPAARERRGADRRPVRRRLRDRSSRRRASRRTPKACWSRFAAWAARSRRSSRDSSNAASTSRRIARSGRSKTARRSSSASTASSTRRRPRRPSSGSIPELEAAQIARLRAVRAGRSAEECAQALAAVDRAARGGDNLVPPIIAAVERHATLGEIADTLRAVFGEHRDTTNA